MSGDQTISRPGLLQRVAGAVRYTITGQTPSWFGPGQPPPPQAQQVEGRVMDFPPSVNLQQHPRFDEEISAEQLRSLAENCDVLKLVIQTRKDQLAAQKGQFQLKNKKARGTDDPRLELLNSFFESPDQEHDFHTWLGMVLDDLFVLDAPTVYPRRNYGGQIWGFEPIDGATIVRKFDDFGRTPLPPDPAYQQLLHGLPAVDYTRDTLIYMPRALRTHRAYGQSPVQQIVMTVNVALRRSLYQLEYYTQGSTPDTWAGMPDNWTPTQIQDYEQWFNALLSGDTSKRRQVKFGPESMIKSIRQMKEGVLKDEFDEWISRIVCYAFSVSPQAFVKQMNRGTGETAQAMANAEGLQPLMQWVARFLNRCVMVGWGWSDIEWTWHEEEETNPQEQVLTSTTYLKSAVLTINEVRADIGRDPIEGGDIPLIFTATGAVPLHDAIKPPEPPAIGHNGGPSLEDDKDGSEALEEEELLTKAATGAGRLSAIWQSFFAHERAGAAKALSHLAPSRERTVAKAAGDDDADPEGAAKQPAPASDDMIDAAVDAAIRDMGWPVVQSSTSQMLEQSAVAGVKEGGTVLDQVLGISVASNPKGGGSSTAPVVLNATRLANPRAVAAAQERAAELVSGVSDTTRDALRALVVKAQTEGWTTKQLSDAIESNYAFGGERAWVIARTELSRSSNAGNIEGWRQAAKLGVKVQKRVILGQNENHCLACTSAVMEGAIPLDDSWAVGFQPPFHPSCYCTLVPVVESSVRKAYDPDQPRGADGKWAETGLPINAEHEIAHGRAAMEQCLAHHSDVLHGMMSRVGSVAFLYGKAGPSGYGIAHMLEERAAQGIDGHAMAMRVPEIIARGKGTPLGDTRYRYEYQGEQVVLTTGNRHPGIWMLTAYDPRVGKVSR